MYPPAILFRVVTVVVIVVFGATYLQQNSGMVQMFGAEEPASPVGTQQELNLQDLTCLSPDRDPPRDPVPWPSGPPPRGPPALPGRTQRTAPLLTWLTADRWRRSGVSAVVQVSPGPPPLHAQPGNQARAAPLTIKGAISSRGTER